MCNHRQIPSPCTSNQPCIRILGKRRLRRVEEPNLLLRPSDNLSVSRHHIRSIGGKEQRLIHLQLPFIKWIAFLEFITHPINARKHSLGCVILDAMPETWAQIESIVSFAGFKEDVRIQDVARFSSHLEPKPRNVVVKRPSAQISKFVRITIQ